MGIKDGQYKSLINKLRDEKQLIEKQLLDTEFILGGKERELQKERDSFIAGKQQLIERVRELEDKVSFFRQNQRLLTDADE